MKGVTIDTIGGGALAELFGVEMQKVLANVADINTDPKQKRTITLTITLKPNRDRDVADVDLKCASKLAGIQTVQSQVFMGRHAGKLIAVEHDPRQQKLFDQPKPELVSNGNTTGTVTEFQSKDGK